jgi:hypothetical protein
MKLLCQSVTGVTVSTSIQFRQCGVADRPQAHADAWTRGGDRTPAVAPPVSPRGLQGRHDARVLPPFPLPPSFVFNREKPSRHCCLHSGELARAHHRTTVHQNSPTAPP